MKTLSSLISKAVESTAPGRQRTAALRAIRWRLHCPALGVYAGLDESGGILALPSVTGAPRVHPGDIDHDFTESVNRKHRLARFLDVAVPVSLLIGAMAIGWFAHSIFSK